VKEVHYAVDTMLLQQPKNRHADHCYIPTVAR